MSRPPPTPVFTHFGIDGGVSCIALLEYKDCPSIFVGSQAGRILVFDVETQLQQTVLYDDCEHRPIQFIAKHNDDVIIHIRTLGLLNLEWNIDHYLPPTLICATSHYGYCAATSIGNEIFIPHMKGDDQHILRKLDISTKKLKEVPLQSKGSPMCMTSMDSTRLLIGFEDGNVQAFRGEKMVAEISLFSEPVFCMASCSGRGCKLLFVGSVKTPLKVTSLNDDDVFGETSNIPYAEGALGCSALSISRSGKTLFAGFWNGSIRAFSINKLHVLAVMTWHDETVTSLVTSDKNTVYSGAKDGKLSVWKL